MPEPSTHKAVGAISALEKGSMPYFDLGIR